MADALPSEARVCWYAYPGATSALVRWDTQRPQQPWADVPSHCAIVLNVGGVEILYEFISTGWHSRCATTDDFAWSVIVPLTSPSSAIQAAWSQRGMRYGWLAILEIIACRFVPDRWVSCYRAGRKHICSWFVQEVLTSGGWDCPHWLAIQDQPASPNDLWWALRPKK